MARACATRSRISADVVPTSRLRISLNGTAGTSTWRSMRSSSGPLIFERYRWISAPVQRHSCVVSPRNPHRHPCRHYLQRNMDLECRVETGRVLPIQTLRHRSRAGRAHWARGTSLDVSDHPDAGLAPMHPLPRTSGGSVSASRSGTSSPPGTGNRMIPPSPLRC